MKRQRLGSRSRVVDDRDRHSLHSKYPIQQSIQFPNKREADRTPFTFKNTSQIYNKPNKGGCDKTSCDSLVYTLVSYLEVSRVFGSLFCKRFRQRGTRVAEYKVQPE